MVLIVLAAALGFCALLIWVGPILAEMIIGLFGEAALQNAPLLHTVFTVVLFGLLLIAGIVGARLTGIDPLRLGRRPGSGALAGFLIGCIGVLLATGYGWIAGTLSSAAATGGIGLLLWGTALVVLQAGSEEVYFRGWLQPYLAARWGALAAIAVAALAFAILHIIGGARSPVTILNLFLGGLLFGFLAHRQGGIAAAAAAHIAWNWTEQILLGLTPNPGISSFGAIVDLELAVSALWGGSEEGLNASLAMTFALAVFVVPLALLHPRRGEPVTPPAATAPGRSGPAPV